MASMEAVISSSTNWIVAEGSLSDAISFETSDDDAGAAAEPKRLLLRRPPPLSEEEDPPPCEITIIFRRKHELHRVYLRSTARIYEMYYASDHRNTDTEYLCTVRCGEAVKEVTSPIVTEEADECQGNDKGAAAPPEQVARSDSTTSDEDGWIQVKVPDSPQENKKNPLSKSSDSPNMQIHYEATAEISDFSPCVSLTLRLLSIQTEDCVHVEEIYIYADPVDSTSLDPPTTMSETSGGSSLLAMLVPSLLELSKSRSCRMQEKGSSEEPRGPNYQCDTKPAHTISMGLGKTLVPEAYSSCISPGPIQEPSEVNSGKRHLEPSKKVPELNQTPNSSTDQHINMCCNHLEKSLDELLSRVGRIEAFCSRFEENMMKPLSSMDVRLQEVEHKLDSFVARHQSSEQLSPPSRLSAPEFLFEEADSENKFCNTECRGTKQDIIADTVLSVDDMASSPPEFGTRPGLVVKAPEFPNEDDECVDTDDNLYEESVSVNNLCNTEGREAREDTIADAVLPVDAMASSSHELETSTGLTAKALAKAPEGCIDTNDTSQSSLECPRKDKAMSIDDVIASTLKAFLTSNTVRSPNTSSTLGGISQVCSVTNGTLDSIKSVVSEDDDCISVEKEKGVCSGDSSLVFDDAAAPYNKPSEADTENRGCDTLNAIREDTVLNDSLLLFNSDMNCTVSSFHLGSSSKSMDPEISKENEPSKHDGTSDLVERSYSTSHVVQSVLPLAEFQNLATVQSNKNSPIPVTISSGLSDSNDFTVSSVAVPCKGANASCIKNSCEVNEDNEMKVKVYLNQIRNILPRKVRWEKQEHDYGKCRCGAVDVEACACLSSDGILKQKDYDDAKWNEQHHLPTSDELLTQNLTFGCPSLGLSRGVRHNFWPRANDDDCEKVVPLSGFVSRWNDEYRSYSCSSSLDEHFVGNKVGIGRSDGGSIDSSRGDSTHVLVSDDSDGETTDSSRGNLTPIVISDDSDCEESGHISRLGSSWMGEYSCNSSPDDYFIKDKVDIVSSDGGCTDSSHSAQQVGSSIFGNVSPVSSFENKSIGHYDFATATHQSFEGYSQMKPNAGLGRELSSSTLDSEDIYNVKFASEKDWISGLPLEVLLGECPDAREHKAAVMGEEEGGDDGVSSEKQQNIPSSSRGTDGNADADGKLLLNLEDSALLTEDELKALANIPLYTGSLF